MNRGERDRIRESYDETPYEGGAHYWTHPMHLATVATLLGLTPTPPVDSRVLEIGCATGGNLLPMAAQLPESEFVGVDLSPAQIEQGRLLAEAAGLTNVRLEAMDIADAGADLGLFDYIICHGVFSWVPAPVRAAILELCRATLSPNGIAYVSYNAFPGSQTRALARGIARFGAGYVLQDATDVSQVLALWRAARDAMPTDDHVVAHQLNRVLDEVEGSRAFYVAHEYLEDVNEPLWFYEFAQAAGATGLQYLGEAAFLAQLSDFPESTQEAVARMAPDLIAREQWVDLCANVAFRRSLLCHSEVVIPRQPRFDDVVGLRVAASSVPVGEEEGAGTYKTRSGREFSTNVPVLRAALEILYEAWPGTIEMSELHRQSVRQMDPAAAPEAPQSLEYLAQSLLQLWLSNAVALIVAPFPNALTTGERPSVHPLAREQAARGIGITNLMHQTVELPNEDRAILALLDGQRTLAELAEQGPGRTQADVQDVLDRLIAMALLEASPTS